MAGLPQEAAARPALRVEVTTPEKQVGPRCSAHPGPGREAVHPAAVGPGSGAPRGKTAGRSGGEVEAAPTERLGQMGLFPGIPGCGLRELLPLFLPRPLTRR